MNAFTSSRQDLPKTSETGLWQSLDRSLNGIVLSDLSSRVLYVNAAWLQMWGHRSADEAIGTLGTEWPWLAPEEAKTALRVVLEAGQWSGRLSAKLRDGRIAHFEVAASLVAGPTGKAEQIFVCFVDVSSLHESVKRERESGERFANLVKNLNVGVLLQGPEQSITFCNEAALRLLGLEREQLLGSSSYDPRWRVIGEDGGDFPREEYPITKAIRTGQPVKDVVMGVHRPVSDDWVWLLASADPQHNADGSLKEVICVFTDISQRRRQSEALAYKDYLLENVNDAIFSADEAGRILNWNAAAERIYGYTAEEAIGQLMPELFDESGLGEPTFGQLLRYVGRYGHWSGEVTQLHKSGRRLLIHASLQRLSDAQGRHTGLAVVNRDLTSIQQKDTHLTAILENTEDLIWGLDREGRLQTFNSRFREAVAEHAGSAPQPEDVYFDLLDEPFRSRAMRAHRLALDGQKATFERFYNASDDRTTVWMEYRCYPIRNESGRITGVSYLGRDVSERRENELRVQEMLRKEIEASVENERIRSRAILEGQEQERERVAMELHDGVGQILTALQMNTASLRNAAAKIKDERLARRCQEILDLSKDADEEIRRISSNLMPSALHQFGLLEGLRDLATRIRRNLGIAVEERLDFEESKLDRTRATDLFRIAQELTNNAVKHSGATRIHLRLTQDGTLLNLYVADNGKGYDPEAIQKGPRGFGLRNLEQRVRLLEGEYELRAAPGKGVKAYVSVPVVSSKEK